ncbi:MAG: metallophosphoesterase family protein [Anaerolineaceae bacterium]|nr:metallophosphoesterase family protein [Anaerolineaceae bacterium]
MSGYRIGVISDTHGLLRKEVLRELENCQHILHAGDVGKPEILDTLQRIAPLTVVRGNVDGGSWADILPETAKAQVQNQLFYLIHNLAELDINPATGGFCAVIYGHSHHARQEYRQGVLYLNPGSAGPSRFGLPASMALLRIQDEEPEVDFVTLPS